jgi:hypothetical protein
MYVDRASCRPPKTRWPIVNSTGVYGERAGEEIVAEVEQNLIQEFRLADDPQMSDPKARLSGLLRERQRDGRPVFAALRFSTPVVAALPELQLLLPSVTFILLSGNEFPASTLLVLMVRRRLQSYFARLRREIRVYQLLLQDSRTPNLAKWLLGFSVGSLLPFDIIPDFIPVLKCMKDHRRIRNQHQDTKYTKKRHFFVSWC